MGKRSIRITTIPLTPTTLFVYCTPDATVLSVSATEPPTTGIAEDATILAARAAVVSAAAVREVWLESMAKRMVIIIPSTKV